MSKLEHLKQAIGLVEDYLNETTDIDDVMVEVEDIKENIIEIKNTLSELNTNVEFEELIELKDTLNDIIKDTEDTKFTIDMLLQKQQEFEDMLSELIDMTKEILENINTKTNKDTE